MEREREREEVVKGVRDGLRRYKWREREREKRW